MESSFLVFLLSFGVMIFAEQIAQKIIKKKRSLKPFMSLYVMVVGFGLIVYEAVTPTFEHKTSELEFYSMISMLVGYMIIAGLQQRKAVVKKMLASYYFLIGCYTYVFLTLSVMVHLLLPFSKFV